MAVVATVIVAGIVGAVATVGGRDASVTNRSEPHDDRDTATIVRPGVYRSP